MKSVEMPQRAAWVDEMARLAMMDTGTRSINCPARLPLDQILVLPSLFQPRGQSLGFCPGASARHVEEMARAVTEGRTLDPVVVVAFGERWILVDGHHRIAAYREAAYTDPVPVTAHESGTAGQERVAWAVTLSTSLNAKDKLSMSAADKVDSAWRLVVMVGYDMTKDQLVEASTVGERTVGSMRAVRKVLLDGPHSPENLYDLSWQQAKFEYRRLKGDVSEPDPNYQERQLRVLMRKLSGAIDARLPASALLEALDRLRPGLELELETAIQLAKERRKEQARAEELLNI